MSTERPSAFETPCQEGEIYEEQKEAELSSVLKKLSSMASRAGKLSEVETQVILVDLGSGGNRVEHQGPVFGKKTGWGIRW